MIQNQPRHIIHLGQEAFHDEAACLGKQLAQLLHIIRQIHPRLSWYAADLQITHHQLLEQRAPTPVAVGTVEALIALTAKVDQFESGVFAGVPADIAIPTFRDGGLWTEDDESAELGDTIVEVRAFDTTYWLIATIDTAVIDALTDHFSPRPKQV